MASPAVDLRRLRAVVVDGRLEQVCRDQGLALCVLHGSARHDEHPGDIDLAVAWEPGCEHGHVALVTDLIELVGDSVDAFEQVEHLTSRDLSERTVERFAAERMMTQMVDLATDINGHVAATQLARAPEDYADGFRPIAQVVCLAAETTRELQQAAGLRNVLVHEYVDVDAAQLAAALPRVRPVFEACISAVSRWLGGQDRP